MSGTLRALLAATALAVALAPSARADDYPGGLVREQLELAARGVEADLTPLKPGELLAIEYVGRPVLVYRRTAAERAYLKKPRDPSLADPSGENMRASIESAYASSASLVWARLLLVEQPALEQTAGRSQRDEYLVVGGWSPASGCKVELAKKRSAATLLTDACGKGDFDAAGRALRPETKSAETKSGAPAGRAYNLYIPPHRFAAANKVVIGLAAGSQPPELEFSPANLYRGSDPTYDLIIAARYDDPRMVERALAKGADVNGFREQDGSPLDAAIIGSRIETVKLLIVRGAKPSARSMRAAEVIGRKEVWQMLEAMARNDRTR